MQKLEVLGGKKLRGQVDISGSKNASLPILAATILSDEKISLSNLPRVKDIETMLNLLKSIGSNIKRDSKNKSLSITNNKKLKFFAPYNLVKTMRAGILVLGPMLARFRKAKVSLPGGCSIGTRPIDIHLNCLSKLGVDFKISNGYVYASASNGLVGARIKFPKISVGATENLIIAASMAKGTSILSNCAIEPEIKDLVNFLNKIGAKIKWIGKRTVKIFGVKKFKKSKYKIMPDRIEAGTYMIAAAITEGKILIKGIDPKLIKTEIDLLKKIGVKVFNFKNKLKVIGSNDIKNTIIKTAPYPGFPTDLQAQIMVLLCKAKGLSVIREEIFENRFMHCGELNRMGAKIVIKGSKAYISGNIKLKSAELMATDLRASVCLILAALIAKGKSTINRIYHLDRGYESIEKKLRKIGAKIKRKS